MHEPASPDAKLKLDTFKVSFYRTTDNFNVNISSFDKSGQPGRNTAWRTKKHAQSWKLNQNEKIMYPSKSEQNGKIMLHTHFQFKDFQSYPSNRSFAMEPSWRRANSLQFYSCVVYTVLMVICMISYQAVMYVIHKIYGGCQVNISYRS